MVKLLLPILIILSLGITIPSVFASSINTNEKQYYYGDSVSVYGSVSPVVNGEFVGLRIMNPKNTDIVAIDQFVPKSDGTFSRTYLAQGPKWQMDGLYTVTIFYGEKSLEKKIQFYSNKESQIISVPSVKSDEKKQTSPNPIKNPKLLISDFPNIEKSPQYYFDRYYTEPQFNDWFDKTFPSLSVEEVIGYKSTHVDNFPDQTKPPKYYLDRYSNEPKFQEWFIQQFPDQSIYDVLGYPEEVFVKVPSWIKNNAKWWSSGLISDSDFFTGIEYMISEKIILVDTIPSQNSSTEEIPHWIKNTAKWWGDGLIEEKDFLNSIKFLIENGIIAI